MGTNKGARTSKFLSLILRHDPAAASITLDPQGWAVIDDLLKGMIAARSSIDRAELDAIVAEDSKGRYSFSEDGTKIRANQGHSINIDLGLVAQQPPDLLYHGTATRFSAPIMAEGLKRMSRHHVHLSDNFDTARTVGGRHGSPLVLGIDAKTMYNDGIKFYRSENGVWLVDAVDQKYFGVTHG